MPDLNKKFMMIETSTYFESYKHVLEALVSLKKYRDEEFPFKKHLVDCKNEQIERPRYLRNALMDFS
jgi:hypothetical protein